MNVVVEFVPLIAALISMLLGLYGLLMPLGALQFVGLALDPARPEGISEARATFGGVFFGMSLYAVATHSEAAYLALGFAWFAAFLARLFSTFFDEVGANPNLPGLVLEFLVSAGILVPLVLLKAA